MQAIERPFGVSVYGSAILRTEPDVAEIELGVGRVTQKASDAFQATQKGTAAVRRSLQQSGLGDDLIEVARVSLESAYQGFGENRKFIGYKAYVKFRLVVKDLDRLEQLLSDAVEAGANEVQSVSYQASRLRELRVEARRLAVEAARAKADVYAMAAGARVGEVLHIEDVNPDFGMRERGHGGGGVVEAPETASPGVLQSGSLSIYAAVNVGYALLHD